MVSVDSAGTQSNSASIRETLSADGAVVGSALIRTIDEASDSAAAVTRARDFLARMSHEIRTPMNGVLGMTQLLARTQLDDEQKRLAQTVEQSAESLLVIDRMVGELQALLNAFYSLTPNCHQKSNEPPTTH